MMLCMPIVLCWLEIAHESDVDINIESVRGEVTGKTSTNPSISVGTILFVC